MDRIAIADYDRTTPRSTLYVLLFPDSTEQVRCPACDAWVHATSTKNIAHSKRCTLRHLQPDTAPSMPKPARERGRENTKHADGLTGQELLEKFHRGYLTMSEAMNTDF